MFYRIAILSFIWMISFQLESSAQSTFAMKCTAFGEIPKDDNPSKQHINCLLTNAAIEADIPPEVVKAVVTTENGSWQHFKSKGIPNIAPDNGIGLMQVTDRLPNASPEQQAAYEQRLATDIVFNIEEGLRILSEKYKYNLPKITGANRQHIENWYFAVMAYNGTVQKNRPVFLASGLPNTAAYQEKVFAAIEKDSFLNSKYPAETILAKYPFKPEHFPNVGTISIGFNVKSYSLDEPLHSSIYNVKKGDQVVLTATANVRNQPNTSSNKIEYPKGTILKVEGDFTYTSPSSSSNQFVWFPTKNDNGKLSGYISSAYLEKVEQSQLDVTPPTLPVVNTITDKAKNITGETEPFANVYVKINRDLYTIAANAQGQFTLNLSKPLLANTAVSIYAVDLVGNIGKTRVIKVKDVTPPNKAK
ncbi:MAG: Ig-like domain-containing protein, partial [Lysinibacillus sp.]